MGGHPEHHLFALLALWKAKTTKTSVLLKAQGETVIGFAFESLHQVHNMYNCITSPMTLTYTYSRHLTFGTLAPRFWHLKAGCTKWIKIVLRGFTLLGWQTPVPKVVNACQCCLLSSKWQWQWSVMSALSVLSYAFLATFFAICWKAEQLWSTKWASSRRMRIEIAVFWTRKTSLERCDHAGMGLQLAQLLATGYSSWMIASVLLQSQTDKHLHDKVRGLSKVGQLKWETSCQDF